MFRSRDMAHFGTHLDFELENAVFKREKNIHHHHPQRHNATVCAVNTPIFNCIPIISIRACFANICFTNMKKKFQISDLILFVYKKDEQKFQKPFYSLSVFLFVIVIILSPLKYFFFQLTFLKPTNFPISHFTKHILFDSFREFSPLHKGKLVFRNFKNKLNYSLLIMIRSYY